jgi:hypothetical protein
MCKWKQNCRWKIRISNPSLSFFYILFCICLMYKSVWNQWDQEGWNQRDV